MIHELFCCIVVAFAVVGLMKLCRPIQNLLWEKNVQNKDGHCMEVIRLKV